MPYRALVLVFREVILTAAERVMMPERAASERRRRKVAMLAAAVVPCFPRREERSVRNYMVAEAKRMLACCSYRSRKQGDKVLRRICT